MKPTPTTPTARTGGSTRSSTASQRPVQVDLSRLDDRSPGAAAASSQRMVCPHGAAAAPGTGGRGTRPGAGPSRPAGDPGDKCRRHPPVACGVGPVRDRRPRRESRPGAARSPERAHPGVGSQAALRCGNTGTRDVGAVRRAGQDRSQPEGPPEPGLGRAAPAACRAVGDRRVAGEPQGRRRGSRAPSDDLVCGRAARDGRSVAGRECRGSLPDSDRPPIHRPPHGGGGPDSRSGRSARVTQERRTTRLASICCSARTTACADASTSPAPRAGPRCSPTWWRGPIWRSWNKPCSWRSTWENPRQPRFCGRSFVTRKLPNRCDSRALSALVERRLPGLVQDLHALVDDSAMRGPVLRALAAYDDPATPEILLTRYGNLPESDRNDAIATLAARHGGRSCCWMPWRAGVCRVAI